jgi:hypothetical protein
MSKPSGTCIRSTPILLLAVKTSYNFKTESAIILLGYGGLGYDTKNYCGWLPMFQRNLLCNIGSVQGPVRQLRWWRRSWVGLELTLTRLIWLNYKILSLIARQSVCWCWLIRDFEKIWQKCFTKIILVLLKNVSFIVKIWQKKLVVLLIPW